jgi:hypothetical protein
MGTPSVPADAVPMLPAREVPLSSERPSFRPEDVAALKAAEGAALTEGDVPEGFVMVRGEFRPNFAVLERLGDPDAGEALLRETGRLNGYFVQFDGIEAGALQLTAYVDLFAADTGAALALRRAPEFQNVSRYETIPAPRLGDEAAAFYFSFPAQDAEAYELAVRTGRMVVTVTLFFPMGAGSLDPAVPLAHILLARLSDIVGQPGSPTPSAP